MLFLNFSDGMKGQIEAARAALGINDPLKFGLIDEYLSNFDDGKVDRNLIHHVIFVSSMREEDNALDSIRRLKSHPLLRKIPALGVGPERDGSTILPLYDLGMNSYIRLPESQEDAVDRLGIVLEYWLRVVALPTPYLRENAR